MLDCHSNSNFTFLSYNIQMSSLDVDGHKWSYDNITNGKVGRYLPVVEMINKADLCALQEVTHHQFVDLKQLLPDYEFIGVNIVTENDLSINCDPLHEGLVICYKPIMFTLNHPNSNYFVPFQGDWLFKKGFQVATLQHVVNGKQLTVFNSHFPHDDNPKCRIDAAAMELREINKYCDNPIICAGDRNFHFPRDQLAYDLYHVNKPTIIDSKLDANTVYDNPTFIGYQGHVRMNTIVNNTLQHNNYLDVIYHKNLKCTSWCCHLGEYDDNYQLLPYSHLVVRDCDKRNFASDHSAILTTFHFGDH